MEADTRRHTSSLLKTRDFTPFSKYYVFRSKVLVLIVLLFQIQGVKT